jgi:hypothetical protein
VPKPIKSKRITNLLGKIDVNNPVLTLTIQKKINNIQVCLSKYQIGLEAWAVFQYNLRAQWDIFKKPASTVPITHTKTNEEDSCILNSYPTEIEMQWMRCWNPTAAPRQYLKKSNPCGITTPGR